MVSFMCFTSFFRFFRTLYYTIIRKSTQHIFSNKISKIKNRERSACPSPGDICDNRGTARSRPLQLSLVCCADIRYKGPSAPFYSIGSHRPQVLRSFCICPIFQSTDPLFQNHRIGKVNQKGTGQRASQYTQDHDWKPSHLSLHG